MAKSSMVVPEHSPHKMYRGGRMGKKEKQNNLNDLITRAKEENWHWQPYEDMPPQESWPVISVKIQSTGETVPMHSLSPDQQKEIRQKIGQVFNEAIKQQIAVMSN